MQAKKCDHKSVGILVWKDGKLLLIERKKFPPGFAIPAGHLDDDVSFEDAARRELKEEVGLEAASLRLIFEGRKENPCRREDGTWHEWKIYEAKADGEVTRSLDETKQAGWFTIEDIKVLAEKNDPGLEPVMRELFKDLGIL
jgi:ADP-ribose pyrophosphatase YjhB (NUDIX family)